MYLYLFDGTGSKRMEGATVYVGTKILLRTALMQPPWNTGLVNKPHDIYHRVDAGDWERLVRSIPVETNFAELLYTLPSAGAHSFYAEFVGDDVYAGCPSEVHGMSVGAQDFGRSTEISLQAAPALTVIVKDMVTKKGIGGASIVVDAYSAVTPTVTGEMGDINGDGAINEADLALMKEAFGSVRGDPNWNPKADLNKDGVVDLHDASIVAKNFGLIQGQVSFTDIPPGTYTLTVSARDYKSETRTVELTVAGMVEEVHLIHVGAIALGIVAAASTGLVVAHQVLKKR